MGIPLSDPDEIPYWIHCTFFIKTPYFILLHFIKDWNVYKYHWYCPMGSVLSLPCSRGHPVDYIWTFLLRLPKPVAPTLVGTNLWLPTAPVLLRNSAKCWVTQVAVLHAFLFCAVMLYFSNRELIIRSHRHNLALNKKHNIGGPRKFWT